ncbi:cytochrome b561 and DOMON domain-containing protein At3g25290-like [Cucurbita moschata]|uniref:Cytochrome b561 and DOMON domain-containing protein n=1 Tax=Cucurbita moschata TaxID=3662 RepID=A0A6J1H602_CUCMO|nr:cytochrome b561 and DOMON domain-containing protein At3g25290-like [Cucurbita moschata]XP_022959841.1 cytochrome b561 and DOMON domain-containing protein At3g25290-like [Cucurbita moschata]
MASSSSSSSSWELWFFLFLSLFFSLGDSLTCSSRKFSNNNLYSRCSDLSSLSAFIHWTYDSSNSSLSVAFVAKPSTSAGWIAWAVNPTSTGMAGSQALVAYLQGGVPVVKTYNVASYDSVKPSKLSFEVWDATAVFSGGELMIFAKLKVPEAATGVNQVWQVGPSVDGTDLGVHGFKPPNLNAKGTLGLSGGGTNSASSGGKIDSRTMRKNIHGVLNAVSWGLLFPIGIVIARYLRVFPSADPAWFYLHISCQISAYAIGTAGWATGLKLGSESEGYVVYDHRNIGIALFSMASLQMLALFLRPKKEHKYRLYWNIYHHSIGYSILILSIINVFKGFNVLSPAHKWKLAYVVAIAVVGGVAVVLEAVTWLVVFKRKPST